MASEQHGPTVGYLVWRLSMKWRTAVDAAVEPLGLTHAQYSVLASLRGMTRGGGRPSQRELADHTGLDAVYVSKLVRALERRGLVERTADPRDSRTVRLCITATGKDTIDRAIPLVHDLLERQTAPLGGTASRRTQALVEDIQTLIAGDTPRPGITSTTERENSQ